MITPPDYYFDIHKDEPFAATIHKRDDNVDQVKNQFQRYCSAFLNFIKLGSIHIADKSPSSESILWKMYRILLILTCIPQILKFLVGTLTIFNTMFDPDKKQNVASYAPVFFCDNFLALLLLLNYMSSRRHISNLIDNILTKMTSLFAENGCHSIFAQFRLWSRFLVLFCLLNWITLFVTSLIPVVSNDDENARKILMTDYWMTLPTSYSKPILATLENFYVIQTACVNIYFSLIAFTCYMLYSCFKQLNTVLKSTSEIRLDNLTDTLHVHQQLANLVKFTNTAFSPTLLALVCVKSAQIVTGVNVLKSYIRYDASNEYCYLAQAIMLFVTAIGIILITTITGGKLYNEAQDTIKVLLECTLKHDDMYQDKSHSILKSCHITILFTAQLLSSPVGISASSLIVINFSLLAVVISTSITYITLISDS